MGETSVTDLKGKIVMNVKAVREADVIRLYIEGGMETIIIRYWRAGG